MPTTSSLKTLIDFAQKQSDVSAKQLGQLNLQKQDAEQKLHLLLQYRHSYQESFQNSAKNGIDHIEWLNFVAFINKLDAAITEQRQTVIEAQNNRNIGGEAFLSCQRKLKSYDTLSQRQQRVENQQQMRNEQKQQDEYASNKPIYNRPPPESS
jgi:flagellar protein FliJ